MKKTWQEKLMDKESLPKVLKLEKGFPLLNHEWAIDLIKKLLKLKIIIVYVHTN